MANTDAKSLMLTPRSLVWETRGRLAWETCGDRTSADSEVFTCVISPCAEGFSLYWSYSTECSGDSGLDLVFQSLEEAKDHAQRAYDAKVWELLPLLFNVCQLEEPMANNDAPALVWSRTDGFAPTFEALGIPNVLYRMVDMSRVGHRVSLRVTTFDPDDPLTPTHVTHRFDHKSEAMRAAQLHYAESLKSVPGGTDFLRWSLVPSCDGLHMAHSASHDGKYFQIIPVVGADEVVLTVAHGSGPLGGSRRESWLAKGVAEAKEAASRHVNWSRNLIRQVEDGV